MSDLPILDVLAEHQPKQDAPRGPVTCKRCGTQWPCSPQRELTPMVFTVTRGQP